MRPSLEELAKAREGAERMLTGQPVEKPSEVLKVLLRATAPPTKEEAIPTLVKHANETGNWSPKDSDEVLAELALDMNSDETCSAWQASIRAQWATLVHFCGGAREP